MRILVKTQRLRWCRGPRRPRTGLGAEDHDDAARRLKQAGVTRPLEQVLAKARAQRIPPVA